MSTPLIGPLCDICKHIRADYSCAVFPKRIPSIILAGYDHTKPVRGDKGIVFEARGPDDPVPDFIDLMLEEFGSQEGC